MRVLTTLLLASLFLLVNACGEPGPSEADLAAEAEAERIDSINQELEASVETVEATAEELIDALDSLTVFFPEEE